MNKKKLLMWVTVVLMVFTAMNGVAQVTQSKNMASGYVKRQLLFLPWGKGENQVGLKEEQIDMSGSARGGGLEVVRHGPSRIEIDKNDDIYIFDDYNNRVLKYDMAGRPLPNIPFTKETKESILSSIEKFQGKYGYKRSEKNDISMIEIMDEFHNKVSSIKYDAAYKKPISFDNAGNLYILHDTTLVGSEFPGSEFWIIELSKYSKDGELLAKFKLSDDIDYTDRSKGQRNRIKIDKRGNIYQLIPKKEGVYLLKWEMSNEKK
jgi:hypothetical protein